MMNSAILLSVSAFKTLSRTAQQEVLRAMGIDGLAPDITAAPAAAVASPEEGPPELTLALVRKLTDKLSEKTLTALKVIARSETPHFHLKDVVAATSGAESHMDLRAVWSALTRRTRAILDDGEADLIWWDGEIFRDEDDTIVDRILRVSPLTHASLKAHFRF